MHVILHEHTSILIYTHSTYFWTFYINNALNIVSYSYSKALRHNHIFPIMYLLVHFRITKLPPRHSNKLQRSFLFPRHCNSYNGLIYFSRQCKSYSGLHYILKHCKFYSGLNYIPKHCKLHNGLIYSSDIVNCTIVFPIS